MLGENGDFDLALLDIEDCVSRIALREDDLFLRKDDNFPALADGGQEFSRIEIGLFPRGRGRCHHCAPGGEIHICKFYQAAPRLKMFTIAHNVALDA